MPGLKIPKTATGLKIPKDKIPENNKSDKKDNKSGKTKCNK